MVNKIRDFSGRPRSQIACINLHEGLAQDCDTLKKDGDVHNLLKKYTEEYLYCTGVLPDERHTKRAELESLLVNDRK